MELSVERPAGIRRHSCKGECGRFQFQAVDRQVETLRPQGVDRVALEISGCEYMSSSGLVALNAITKILRGERTRKQRTGGRF